MLDLLQKMKEDFMNKVSNSNEDYEMLDDYSELLEKNWSKVVRGKHYHSYPKDKQPVVRITGTDSVRFVKLKQLEVQAVITPDLKLIAQVPLEIPPGEHQVSLLIGEPVNLTSQVAIASEDDNKDVAKTFEVEAIITPDNKLTAQLNSDITPGEYPATLIIEEPTNQHTLSSTDENHGEEENTEPSS